MNQRPSDRTSERRDAELALLLRESDAAARPSDAELRALGTRIMTAAQPILDARSAAERTVWD
jgi:hypothetical protein